MTSIEDLDKQKTRNKLFPQSLAQDLYDYLTTHRVGKEQSVLDLVQKKLGRGIIETNIDLMEVLGHLEEITSAAGEYTLDFSKYDDQFVGLPYAIPFVFKRSK